MRFRELRLLAYGPFTDQVIDFGDPEECDLHVVLGLNEAGKSSALRAIRALLFGFPHITRDAHVYPYERLRVGALLESNDGQTLELARVKARQRDLRDSNDEPVDDGVLRHMLGGIDEALYDRLFLVDQKELRQGGSGLLAGGGDLGVSLFGATLGGGNLAVVRRKLHERAEGLFKPDGKARKPLLNAALNGYHNHMDQARALSVKPREYDTAATRRDELARERHEKTGEVAQLEREERALHRLVSVTGPLARREGVVAELTTLADVPVLGEDARTRREVALEQRDRATGQLATAKLTHEGLVRDLAAVVVPGTLLERAAEIQTLAGRLDTHEKALGDRSNRSRELELQKKTSLGLRTQLGSAAPADAVPVDRSVRAAIESLGDEHVTLLERQRVATEHLQECDVANTRAAQALSDASAPPDSPDLVVTWTAAAGEQVPLVLAADQQKRAVEHALGKLMATIRALSPPFDPQTPEATEPPPPSVISAHKRQVEDLASELAETRAERTRLARRRDELQVQLAALGADGVEGTKEQMAAARAARDEHFAGVGELLDATDLEGARTEFQQLGMTLTQADELADLLLAQAELVARRDHLATEIAEIVKQLGEREEEISDIETQREELLVTWRALWQPCAIAPLDDPNAMLVWRERYDELTAQHADLALQLGEHERALSRAEEIAANLRAALEASGSSTDADLPVGQLVEHARSVVERTLSAIGAHQQLATDATAADRELATAKRGLEQAESELRAWAGRWASALQTLAIPVDTLPAAARGTLTLLDDLAISEATATDLEHRIASITADYDAFATDVAALGAEVAPDRPATEALELIRVLDQQVEAAKAAATEHTRLQGLEHVTKERISELEGEQRDADGVLSRLCDQAHCATPEELPEIEQLAARRDALINDRAELDKRIVEQGEQPIAELLSLLGERTGDDLAAELATHHDILTGAKNELEALVEQHTEAIGVVRQLDHGIDAALERERAEHEAARAAELAERYLAERAAAILLTRAIEHHREHSAQPILERAQQLLPQLTAGSLTRLFVDDEGGDHPVLMARRANSGELGVDGMSDGTLDQLYLALRLAALEHHLDALPPLPVLLDDILVNYDEPRVTTSAPALGELAQRTQVIVLTHHKHVATIAQETLGNRVRVHSLSTLSAGSE
jgi:uncharacterized protein YhaN